LALVEVSVVEQRYRAVLEVKAGIAVTEVAARSGVSRQSVHAWLRRYEQGGLGGLADRSRRPDSCPHQVSAEIEAAVCELRREHPKWGPLRLAHELGKAGVIPAPSRMSVYRVLVRHGLIEPEARKRPKSSYRRATGRAVCLAFAAALRAYGVPGEVLTDIQYGWCLREAAHCPAGGVRLPGDRRLPVFVADRSERARARLLAC